MFTGIVQAVGLLRNLEKSPRGTRIEIDISGLDQERVRIGDSIAVNGACLTVAHLENEIAGFDVSVETLDKCLIGNWDKTDTVNLELALTMQTPLGGHLVSGHVDGIGSVVSTETHSGFTQIQFQAPAGCGKYIASKGSISIDGVSLTVNTVSGGDDDCRFDIMLVPHTLHSTTLANLQPGSRVHVEVDQIARYIHRMNQCQV